VALKLSDSRPAGTGDRGWGCVDEHDWWLVVRGGTTSKCDNWPAIYKRLIDDGFFVWEHDEASLLAFLQLLNSKLQNINITWKYSQHSIDYMDLTVTKCAGTGSTVGLKVTTYQKPHNQYMYIPYFSFHRRGVYNGFIKADCSVMLSPTPSLLTLST
jgi:hypothetical protein